MGPWSLGSAGGGEEKDLVEDSFTVGLTPPEELHVHIALKKIIWIDMCATLPYNFHFLI